MEDFGNFLKHERELRGIPLEEIADNTKIHVRFLKALENNHYDELPGEVFIKGYIRSYAKSIGTNVEEILSAYDESIGKQRKGKWLSEETQKNKQYLRKQNLRKWILACVAILCAFSAYFILTQYLNKKSPAPQISPLTEKPVPVPTSIPSLNSHQPEKNTKKDSAKVILDDSKDSSEDIIPALVPAETEKSLKESPKNDIIQPSEEQGVRNAYLRWASVKDPSESLELTIRVQEESWFNLTIDGVRQEDFILPKGAGKTFSGNQSFNITIGNRNGVTLAWNGNPIDLPDSKNNVIRNLLIKKKISAE